MTTINENIIKMNNLASDLAKDVKNVREKKLDHKTANTIHRLAGDIIKTNIAIIVQHQQIQFKKIEMREKELNHKEKELNYKEKRFIKQAIKETE